jgi:biotin carboxylase
MPARLPAARYRNVLNLAERAAEALDTSGAVRVDLLVTEGQNEYVLEVNTLPGMTPTSLLPKIAAAAGYNFGELCLAILNGARVHTRQEHIATASGPADIGRADTAAIEHDTSSVLVKRYGVARRSQRSRTA